MDVQLRLCRGWEQHALALGFRQHSSKRSLAGKPSHSAEAKPNQSKPKRTSRIPGQKSRLCFPWNLPQKRADRLPRARPGPAPPQRRSPGARERGAPWAQRKPIKHPQNGIINHPRDSQLRQLGSQQPPSVQGP